MSEHLPPETPNRPRLPELVDPQRRAPRRRAAPIAGLGKKRIGKGLLKTEHTLDPLAPKLGTPLHATPSSPDPKSSTPTSATLPKSGLRLVPGCGRALAPKGADDCQSAKYQGVYEGGMYLIEYRFLAVLAEKIAELEAQGASEMRVATLKQTLRRGKDILTRATYDRKGI